MFDACLIPEEGETTMTANGGYIALGKYNETE